MTDEESKSYVTPLLYFVCQIAVDSSPQASQALQALARQIEALIPNLPGHLTGRHIILTEAHGCKACAELRVLFEGVHALTTVVTADAEYAH